MNEKKIIESQLKLLELCFDRFEFNRVGKKNNNNPTQTLSAQIGKGDNETYKIVLELKVKKDSEYDIFISAHGLFQFFTSATFSDDEKKILIQKNAVAIMMPYIRSQLTLMTSQPNVDPIVMPPLNIAAILDNK